MTQSSGYITLLTTIIISTILLIVVTAVGSGSVMHRFNVADAVEKSQSKYLAEGCAYKALVNLAYDKAYSGGETITFPSGETCSIDNIPPPAPDINIFTRASIDHHLTRFSATIKSSDMSIISWQEIPQN